MSTNDILLILYPINELGLNDKQKEFVITILSPVYKNISKPELDELFEKKTTSKEIKEIVSSLKEKDKLKYFSLAKSIIEATHKSKDELTKLAELGKALKIAKKDTGFDFDLYNIDELNEYEFRNTLRAFSLVSAAIGFIPFIPIADYAIISSIQVGMLAKIANIYNFKLEPKKFLQMLGGTLGTGFIFKLFSKIICSLIPFFGWAINSAVAYAGTFAIGILLKAYIENNGELSKESINTIWEKSFAEGKKEFAGLKDYIFAKKDDLIKEYEKYKNQKNKKNSTNKTEVNQ